MLRKQLGRSAWTCCRCLRQQLQRRAGSSLAANAPSASQSEVPSSFRQIDYATPDTKHDERVLRQIFDSHRFWNEFSHRSKQHSLGRSAGLFQNRYLTKPEGFQKFAEATLRKCQRIVEKVVTANSMEELRDTAKDLDRLSDLLCRVIDLADFVRSTHPDQLIQAAATNAYAMMFEYMNKLNTMTELNDQLKRAAAVPEIWSSWSGEEQVVAKILMKDFSKSAIDLPEGARNRFVELSNEIVNVGNEFVDSAAPEETTLTFPSHKLKGMEPMLARRMTSWGKISLPTVGIPATMALRHVEDPDVRREVYMANRTSSKRSIELLEQMLRARAELAELSGYPTFAHMALSDKMAGTPEAVNQFLGTLSQSNAAIVQDELSELLEFKRADGHKDNFSGHINAWDRDYYTSRLLSTLHTKIRSPDFLSAYFSLGTVMQGLSRLFSRLYGIRLVPRETSPGETWNDDVRRLDVVDEVTGHIAVVYCDLFSRPGKNPNPAHFTLRCSRRIAPSEIEEAAQFLHPFSNPVEAATDGMAYAPNPLDNNALYQLPTIALICDFARPSQPSRSGTQRPTLLTFREVQTLFHEMGHAVHSMLGRTALQNVAGTRCATDFAELPSVLMEHFAACPSVLSLYARHWDTDAPLPMAALEERLSIDTRMSGAETESQILLAMLDQSYHNKLPSLPEFSSTKTYHDVYNDYASVPEPTGTAWQGFFGHLFGYGATYYSYLFDRAIAGRLWEKVFKSGREGGAIDRANGERYKEEVLRWGGGRDGWKCIAGVLKDERLSSGGEEAMREVGRWGVKAEGSAVLE